MAPSTTDLDVAHFRALGYVVLRQAIDAEALSAELDRSLVDGFEGADGRRSDAAGIEFRYLPMMSERTPVSLALLDRFAPDAARLLGVDVLPLRAKGVRYVGNATWHTDSDHQLASVGFAAYLEPLDAATGALRVLPGSHQRAPGSAMAGLIDRITGTDVVPSVAELPGVAVATEPGDVIVFDEHLFHASSGGGVRRQWRVDYLADPVDDAAVQRIGTYLGQVYPPDWDGGYDVDRYPTYGAHWLGSGRPAVDRLAELGAHGLADAQEAFARAARTGA